MSDAAAILFVCFIIEIVSLYLSDQVHGCLNFRRGHCQPSYDSGVKKIISVSFQRRNPFHRHMLSRLSITRYCNLRSCVLFIFFHFLFRERTPLKFLTRPRPLKIGRPRRNRQEETVWHILLFSVSGQRPPGMITSARKLCLSDQGLSVNVI